LVNGANTIDVAIREDGAAIDKIYLSDSTTVPTGLGQSSTNCAPIENPLAGKSENIESNTTPIADEKSTAVAFDMKVSPNPVNGILNIYPNTTSPIGVITLNIYDYMGRLVMTYENPNLNFDGNSFRLIIDELSAGSYFVEAVTLRGRYTKPIIVRNY